MSQCIEILEGRTLFAVAIPSDLATEYAAVVASNATIKAATTSVVALVTGQSPLAFSGMSGVSVSKPNVALAKKAVAAVRKGETTLKSDTNRYLAMAGAYRRSELAQATFDADPTRANAHRVTAAASAAEKVQDFLQSKLEGAAYSISNGPIETALNALVAANPSSTQLATDVQTAETALQNGSGTESTDLSTAYFNNATLIGEQFA